MNNDKYIIISLFYLSITFFFSCGKSEASQVTTLEISRNEVTFWPESSELIIEIHSNSDVVASSSTSWCKAEIMPNNSSLKISVEKNDEIGIDRYANITVSAK